MVVGHAVGAAGNPDALFCGAWPQGGKGGGRHRAETCCPYRHVCILRISRGVQCVAAPWLLRVVHGGAPGLRLWQLRPVMVHGVRGGIVHYHRNHVPPNRWTPSYAAARMHPHRLPVLFALQLKPYEPHHHPVRSMHCIASRHAQTRDVALAHGAGEEDDGEGGRGGLAGLGPEEEESIRQLLAAEGYIGPDGRLRLDA